MIDVFSVSATALRDYAKARGWKLVREAVDHRLFVLNHDAFRPRQLAFPIDESAPDYRESIDRNIVKLADLEGRNVEQLINDLQHVDSDKLSYRLAAERFVEASIPLSLATRLLAAAESMLRTSACSVIEPRTSYPKLNRKEAQEIASVARFGHTQAGSFILNVSCPIYALDSQAQFESFEDTQEPFVRSATKALYRGLVRLVHAIENDSLDSLSNSSPEQTFVSRNLCEALLEFGDPELKNSLDIGFSWASALPLEPGVFESKVSIKRDYFSYIEHARRVLTPATEAVRSEFLGTVEKLSGKLSEDLIREGEVVLLLFDGTESLRAKAMLNAAQHQDAIESYKTNRYVRLEGVLRPGRQPQLLDQISRFELLTN